MECIQETEKQSYWKQEFKNVTKCSSKDFLEACEQNYPQKERDYHWTSQRPLMIPIY